MAKLWQLKKLSTNEPLNEPQLLPENWGPIFGMEGFKDQLGNLSWVGMEDQGWFIVGDAPEPEPVPSPEPEIIPAAPAPEPELFDPEQHRLKLLRESDWAVLPDVPMTAAEREAWIAYRAELRDLNKQSGWPDIIDWPPLPNNSIL